MPSPSSCSTHGPEELDRLVDFTHGSHGSSFLDNQEGYHDDYHGDDPAEQVFLGMGIVRGKRIDDKDQSDAEYRRQNVFGYVQNG